MKKPSPKRRVIVDFKKIDDEILSLLVEKYPDGYSDKDVITFKNAKKKTVEAVEVQTEDTAYLVKISERLEIVMEEFDADEEYIYDEDRDFDKLIAER